MEMERASVKGLVLFVLVAGMLAGQSTAASFQECYIPCFILCVIKPDHTAFSCSLECLRDCIIPNSPSDVRANTNTFHFCKLGCASSLCTNISTKHKPGGEKVESCVGSCSEMCTKNYLSP